MFCIEKCSAKNFLAWNGRADPIQDFQVINLHYSTQRSICYTNQEFDRLAFMSKFHIN